MAAARRSIAVHPGSALAERPRLFRALEEAFPVTCRPARDGARADAVLAFGDVDAGALRAAHGAPVLVVSGTAGATLETVQIGRSAAVDARLRGAALFDRVAPDPLRPGPDDAVLARLDGAVVWTASAGPQAVQHVRSALPELDEGDVLYSLLSRHATAAVALVQLLRAACLGADYTPAPLRASLVFDDPNLRRNRYGFIDYPELVRHADEHGYHASMAMIPIDAGRPNRAAARLFAGRPDRLSLVFHGNDHVRSELLAPADAATALGVAGQAVRRIARFERRSGLRVERVMMPPHGLCSEPMARALSAVGFDALSAIHPRPWTADWRTGPLLTGWRPADFVGGCPVIPRIPLTSSHADIALRAFLDHPIVVYAHHEDVADGLDPLAAVAERVKAIGDAAWMSPGRIATSNFALRRDGDLLVLRPYSRRIVVDLPAGVRQVAVERPEDALGPDEISGWSLGGRSGGGFEQPTALTGSGTRIELRLRGAADVDPLHVPAPAWRPWPRMRRASTEARDRVMALSAGARGSSAAWTPRRRQPSSPST